MVWGLYSSNGERLPPRTFTSGKTQEAVVDEVLAAFESHDVVLLRGGVGSGKSIIAATVAGAMGRGIINVPVKALQEQYQRDYEGRLHIQLDGRVLNIRVLKGRDNFLCERHRGKRVRSSNKSLPCTQPLPSGTPRWRVARECPHWSPIYPNEIKSLVDGGECDLIPYQSVQGKKYIHMMEEPCDYYQQCVAYASADLLIYNNAKWHADTLSGRKPLTQLEVFDEGDLFLDGLAMKTRVSVHTLSMLESETKKAQRGLEKTGDREHSHRLGESMEEVMEGFEGLLEGGNSNSRSNEPSTLDSGTEEYLKTVIRFLGLLDTEYASNLRMWIESLVGYLEVTFLFRDAESVTFFVADPSMILEKLRTMSSEKLLFMSATLQEPEVIGEFYGIEDFAVVEGEPRMAGEIFARETGTEVHVNWKNWQDDKFREGYWNTLSKILGAAKRPTLVQIHSYRYLPDEGIDPLIPTRRWARELDQEEDIARFKQGEEDLLFSTKTDRGADFPGDACRSIVLMKYPYPDTSDPFLKTMRKRLGDGPFWRYYRDMARRDFLQQIGRGLRSPDDWVEVWSPDGVVHQELKKLCSGGEKVTATPSATRKKIAKSG